MNSNSTIHSIRSFVLTTAIFAITVFGEDGFKPLFNGKDLAGWIPVNVGPKTFTVREGIIISTGLPTGVMRTERMYENFIIELEWRHLKKGGNAGLFIWGDPVTAQGTPFARGIEVQILDNGYDAKGKNEWFTTHGDIFPIHGATMTPAGRTAKSGRRSFPSEDRSNGAPEWNHYRVVATNGVIRLSVNGKEVTVGTDSSPRKGYICLESEGSECHFRNIQIKELPAAKLTPEQIAMEAEGFVTIYSGIDLDGWRVNDAIKSQWKPRDWQLECTAPDAKPLITEKQYGDVSLIVDWRAPDKKETTPSAAGAIHIGGAVVKLEHAKPNSWHRLHITVRGDVLTALQDGKPILGENPKKLTAIRGRSPIELHTTGPATFASILVREIK